MRRQQGGLARSDTAPVLRGEPSHHDQFPPPEDLEFQLLRHPRETTMPTLPTPYLKTTSNCTGAWRRAVPVGAIPPAYTLIPNHAASIAMANAQCNTCPSTWTSASAASRTVRPPTPFAKLVIDHHSPVPMRALRCCPSLADARISLLKGQNSLVLPAYMPLRTIVSDVRARLRYTLLPVIRKDIYTLGVQDCARGPCSSGRARAIWSSTTPPRRRSPTQVPTATTTRRRPPRLAHERATWPSFPLPWRHMYRACATSDAASLYS